MLANKPYIIGLTGGIGCGKSEAAAYLKELGAVHVDADAISRGLTQDNGEALPEIRRQFGDEYFKPDGTLDRAKLGDTVFSSVAHRRALEKIIHPLVQKIAMMQIDLAGKAGKKVVVLDVPLLFETGMDVLCDETWVMAVDRETQLRRVMERGLTEAQARDRIESQMSSDERVARATRAINTDRPIEKTRSELTSLYQSVVKKLD